MLSTLVSRVEISAEAIKACSLPQPDYLRILNLTFCVCGIVDIRQLWRDQKLWSDQTLELTNLVRPKPTETEIESVSGPTPGIAIDRVNLLLCSSTADQRVDVTP